MTPEIITSQALHALGLFGVALLVLFVGWVARFMVASSAKSRPGRPLLYKLRVYAIVGVVAAIGGYGSAVTYGTHTENCDPYGCDEVRDFWPTDAERQNEGWGTFFLVLGPALVGATLGLRMPVDPKAVEARLKAEDEARAKTKAARAR